MSLISAYKNFTRMSLEKKNSQKVILREKLRNLRRNMNDDRENGRDPIQIFPAEIWAMTLEYLTCAKDRANVSQTCQLFSRLINATTVELLFGKVLPQIYQNMEAEDAMACRKVCRMWLSGVNSYLEKSLHITQTPRDIVEQLELNGNIMKYATRRLGYTHYSQNVEVQRIRDPTANPFLGGTVNLTLDEDTGEFQDNFREILTEKGHLILNLELDGENFNKPLTFLCEAILDGLRNCRDLQRFDLLNWGCSDWSSNEMFDLPSDFCHLVDLESFKVDVKYPAFLQIQDKILAKYSPQLKRVYIHFWNAELYENFSWGNLQKLEILQGNCSQLLENLEKINAPKLQKLAIRLDRSDPQLRNLASTVNHFMNLRYLCLQMSRRFAGFSNDQIHSTSQEAVCFATISTLKLFAKHNEFSFDFLIWFPSLKRLVIQTGEDDERDYLFFDSTEMGKSQHSDSDADNDEDDNSSCWSLDGTYREKRDVSQDLIHLSNYIPTGWHYSRSTMMSTFEELHKSNVWKLFPSLQEITFRHVRDDGRVTKKYPRNLYEWRSKEESEMIQAHLTYVEKRWTTRKLWTKREERKRLQILRKLMTPISNGKHPLQLLPEKIWIRILGYVTDDSDILSVYRTCPLFCKVFNESKTEWLFSKILPLIYDRLDKSDVLHCRLVCKKWLDSTAEFLDNYCGSKNWSLKNDKFEFKFPLSEINPEDRVSSHEHLQEDLKLHPTNPFIGRTVTFLTDESKVEGEDSLSYEILDNFGHHIWHARLPDKEKFSLHNGLLSYSSRSSLTLEMCPNLRSLCIADLLVDFDGSPSSEEIIHQTLTQGLKLPRMPYLESVTIEKYSVHDDFILNRLLWYYDGQLKHLQVPRYFAGGNWLRLEEFVCSGQGTDDWFGKLENLKAPKLKVLELRLDGVKPKLEELLKAIYYRSKLQELRLKFADGYAGFSKEEVVKIMTFHPKLLAPPSLTQLGITTTDKNMCYEFLFFFPYLKTLTIRHGEGTRFWYGMETDEGSEDGSSDASDSWEDLEDVGETDENSGDREATSGEEEEEEETEVLGTNLETDYIQIAEFIENSDEVKCCKEIYASKVWQVLPYLEKLKVEHVNGDGEKEESKIFLYTRDGLDRFLNEIKV